MGLVITPALIRGCLGLPRLGVTSAAWATVISFVVATTWLAFYLRRMKRPLAPEWSLVRQLRVDFGILKAVLKIGVATGVQMIVISLAELALLSLVNGFGPTLRRPTAPSSRRWPMCSFRPSRLPSPRRFWARKRSAPAAVRNSAPLRAPAS